MTVAREIENLSPSGNLFPVPIDGQNGITSRVDPENYIQIATVVSHCAMHYCDRQTDKFAIASTAPCTQFLLLIM